MEDWQRILQVRSLVLTQQEELKSWIKFASICRKSGKLSLSERTLITLLSNDPSCNIDVDPLSVKFPQVCSKVKQHLQNYFVCACTIVASNCFFIVNYSVLYMYKWAFRQHCVHGRPY